ncbi:hypothetical protein [Nonomuraea basaltis]|uniref:hypothetical protein n=1 Tax=Nonomuraea basaltis TaxID=2495887 RepID=UPI00197FA35D|nr:hypothetical protein [Nonomuraea basaltis]
MVRTRASTTSSAVAAGLHHLTRAKANGSHYSSNGVYPLVPGVVRDKEGNLRYGPWTTPLWGRSPTAPSSTPTAA